MVAIRIQTRIATPSTNHGHLVIARVVHLLVIGDPVLAEELDCARVLLCMSGLDNLNLYAVRGTSINGSLCGALRPQPPDKFYNVRVVNVHTLRISSSTIVYFVAFMTVRLRLCILDLICAKRWQ